MENVRSRSGVGGSANELGSLHRGGIAAVLACFGLTGTALDGIAQKVPVRIALETADPVDDIVCTMQDNTRWYVQAKRTANDASIRATLRQWKNQPLQPGDVLVLAVRRRTGSLAAAGEALDRRRIDPAAPLSERLQRGLDSFRTKVEAECGHNADEVMRAARVIGWEVDDVSDTKAENAVMALQGAVVASGHGAAAYRALQGFFRTAAALRSGSTSDRWSQAITDAGVDVFADGLGPPGARAEAARRQLAAYRARLAENLNNIDLSALCVEVPNLEVPDLIQSITIEFEVEGETRPTVTELTHAVRRNRRFMVRGLPGAGKSEGMRQVAAWLASQPTAPLPIHVRLREVAAIVTSAADITIEFLLQLAVMPINLEPPADLMRGLHEAVATGHSVLLLDGLDEAHEKAGIVAAGIGAILEHLHPDTGLVITTRASAASAAHSLNLPTADLAPLKGQEVQNSLATAFGHVIVSNPVERAAWTTEKHQLIAEQARGQADLWCVPLLATLATLRILRGEVPVNNPVRLLAGVVEDSVERWELRHNDGRAVGVEPQFSPGMLMDGFAVLGRALNTSADLTPDAARDLVADALHEWELPRPVRIRIARFIVEFWDETVGVFPEVDGVLQPRSRQFAELGDAFAALNRDSQEQRESWLNDALDNPSKMNAIALAASANLGVARWLISAATNEPLAGRRARAARWVCAMAPEWSSLETADFLNIIQAIAAAANAGYRAVADDDTTGSRIIGRALSGMAARQEESDGPGWRFAATLAGMTLPASVQGSRRSAVERFSKNAGRRAILLSLLDLTEALAADRPTLTAEELVRFRTALTLPGPPRTSEVPDHDKRGTLILHATPPLPFGLEALLLRATEYAQQLSPSDAPLLYSIARRCSVRTYGDVGRALRAVGLSDPEPLMSSALPLDWLESMSESMQLDWLLAPIAGQADPDAPILPNEAWRMMVLANLLDLLELGNASLADIRVAHRASPEALHTLLNALIAVGHLDGAVAQAEAQTVLDSGRSMDEVDFLWERPLRPHAPRRGPFADAMAQALVTIAAEPSLWLSNLARDLLLEQENPVVAEAARAQKNATTWNARRNLSILRAMNARSRLDELKELMAEGPAARSAAAVFVRDNDSPEAKAILAQVLADDDASVRDSAGASLDVVNAARFWTCRFCGTENQMHAYQCVRCNLSSTNTLNAREKEPNVRVI